MPRGQYDDPTLLPDNVGLYHNPITDTVTTKPDPIYQTDSGNLVGVGNIPGGATQYSPNYAPSESGGWNYTPDGSSRFSPTSVPGVPRDMFTGTHFDPGTTVVYDPRTNSYTYSRQGNNASAVTPEGSQWILRTPTGEYAMTNAPGHINAAANQFSTYNDRTGGYQLIPQSANFNDPQVRGLLGIGGNQNVHFPMGAPQVNPTSYITAPSAQYGYGFNAPLPMSPMTPTRPGTASVTPTYAPNVQRTATPTGGSITRDVAMRDVNVANRILAWEDNQGRKATPEEIDRIYRAVHGR